jgi:hypothetical protein
LIAETHVASTRFKLRRAPVSGVVAVFTSTSEPPVGREVNSSAKKIVAQHHTRPWPNDLRLSSPHFQRWWHRDPRDRVSRSSSSAHHSAGHIWAGSLSKHTLRITSPTSGPIGELAFLQRDQGHYPAHRSWVP